MGTWGFGILKDDVARDIFDRYIDFYDGGLAAAECLRRTIREFKSCFDNADEAPLAWFAVAQAQWTCGELGVRVLQRVRRIAETGAGMDLWDEVGPKNAQKRRAAIGAFVKKLESPSRNPRVRRGIKRREPCLPVGACLAIERSDGRFGAAIVTAHPREGGGAFRETYGDMIVAMLKYQRIAPPTLGFFEQRRWRRRRNIARVGSPWEIDRFHLLAMGFVRVKKRIRIVGTTRIRAMDPRESDTYGYWEALLLP